jgi:hypothetical protein
MQIIKIIVLMVFSAILAGCSPAAPQTPSNLQAVITLYEPSDGTLYMQGDLVKVRSLLIAPDGAIELELFVNSQLVRTDSLNSPQKDGTILQPWQPTEPGFYILQTRMTTTSGAVVMSALVTIQVGLSGTTTDAPGSGTTAAATPIPSTTPTPTSDPPRVTANQTSICRFGPGELYPDVSNLQSGQSSPILGRNAETSWWVIQNIVASGTCWIWDGFVTVSGDTSSVPVIAGPPLPEPTAVPLAAPKTVAPAGTYSCRSTIFLEWEPVYHPNGIAHYEWQVTYSGVSKNGTTTSTSVENFLSCSTSYSWQVRAVDNKGNYGPFSAPLNFYIQ